jgi:hypothetical protein
VLAIRVVAIFFAMVIVSSFYVAQALCLLITKANPA